MPVPGRPVFPRSFGCVCSGAFPVRFDHVPSRPASSCPCQPSLADRPPSGPGWLHEIKFDGYRVIACKDGERVRLWARTTSDYSNIFTRIRDAVAALPVDSAVLDGEAMVARPDHLWGRPESSAALRSSAQRQTSPRGAYPSEFIISARQSACAASQLNHLS